MRLICFAAFVVALALAGCEAPDRLMEMHVPAELEPVAEAKDSLHNCPTADADDGIGGTGCPEM